MKTQDNMLKKNLKLIQQSMPKLFYQLLQTDPSLLEFCCTEKGELNLKRAYGHKTYFYHSPLHAQQEADDWFQQLPTNKATVVYVYGIGLGYYYQAAKHWLKADSKRALVFLEQDIDVLYRLFETTLGHELLKNKQATIIYSADLLSDQTLFNELSWTYILCPFAISSLKLYQEVNLEGFTQLSHQISHDAAQKTALVDEYLQYGVVFFRNFYPNLLELPNACLGNGLFGEFKNVPAIICGAGPSLKKNADLLKTIPDKALIFAGGSAFNALDNQGVKPHFGAGVDPNSGQLERISSTSARQTPFFYRNRFFHDALNALKGPRLYLTGSGGYDVAAWFEEQLGLTGDCLDEGHNVVNFCIEIAHALGCDPIILVGVDLAFTDNKKYAEGVIANNLIEEPSSQETEDIDSQMIEKKDIYGEPVLTLWKWVTESEWIAEFAKSHPETTLINATEGGLGVKHALNRSLQETIQLYCKNSMNLKEKIEESLRRHSLAYLKKEKIVALIKAMQDSLQRCIGRFDGLIEEMNEIRRRIKHKQPVPLDLQTPRSQLIEMEIEEEAGYQSILDMFNLIYLRLRHRDIQDLQTPSRRLSVRKNLKKVELHIERLVFLKDVARVNSELINRALR